MYFAEYWVFLAKTVTIVLAILIVAFFLMAMAAKNKLRPKEKLNVKKLNEKYQDMQLNVNEAILPKDELKKFLKEQKLAEKNRKEAKITRRKIFLLHFHGDIKASAVKQLREEITAVCLVATPQDEVVVCVESPGGIVPSYGLAASELARIRKNGIPLTVAVDKIAASGGYMVASVANRIIAAPFAIIGSIGVIAQLPNFHHLLKKHNIEYEQITAGEYKRTISMFGENTEKGRKKLQEEIEAIQILFKQHLSEYRPQLNVAEVATGEIWSATQALNLQLVDELITSDDYLLNASKTCDIYQLTYTVKKNLSEKFALGAESSVARAVQISWEQMQQTRYL